MRVVVADEIVVDDGVEESREVDHGRARYVAEQPEALLERRPAFLLVFEFGDDAKRLAKIFLMKPFGHRRFFLDCFVARMLSLRKASGR